MNDPNLITVPLNIVGSTKFGRFPKISVENTYNMIQADKALVPYPGYKARVRNIGTGQARELFTSVPWKHMVMVVADSVYSISTANTVETIANGQLETESGEVYITENGISQIAIVDKSKNIYVYNFVASTFQVIPVDFRAGYITFQDGYFISLDLDSNSWRLSAPNDATSWAAAPEQVGRFQTKGDRPRVIAAFKRQLLIIGQIVTESWHDVGNTLFPYQRDNSLAILYGVVSPQSFASDFDMNVWIGANTSGTPTLLVSKGGDVQSISTDGIDYFLSLIENPEASSAFLFKESGHIFYQFTFYKDNKSLVYDFNESAFYTLTDQFMNYHIAKRAVAFNNKNYFISFNNTTLYEFGSQFTTYDGRAVPRIRITPPFRRPEAANFSIQNTSLTIEQGISKEVQKVYRSFSKDGGESFGLIQNKEMNNLGRRRNRMQFWGGGWANDLSVKFQFWSGDPDTYIRDDQEMNGTERFVVISGEMTVRGYQ